jgi:Kef-type K+ transport system membrane component KefB
MGVMNSILIVVCYLIVGFIIVFALVTTGWLEEDDEGLAIAIIFSWIFIIPISCFAYTFMWLFRKSIELKKRKNNDK